MKRVLLCALLMGWSAMASAVVYKWVAAQVRESASGRMSSAGNNVAAAPSASNSRRSEAA